jgi:hypothetical protein
MEIYDKKISDITYLSELTPPFWRGNKNLNNFAKRAGLIRANNLRFLQSRKLCAH